MFVFLSMSTSSLHYTDSRKFLARHPKLHYVSDMRNSLCILSVSSTLCWAYVLVRKFIGQYCHCQGIWTFAPDNSDDKCSTANLIRIDWIRGVHWSKIVLCFNLWNCCFHCCVVYSIPPVRYTNMLSELCIVLLLKSCSRLSHRVASWFEPAQVPSEIQNLRPISQVGMKEPGCSTQGFTRGVSNWLGLIGRDRRELDWYVWGVRNAQKNKRTQYTIIYRILFLHWEWVSPDRW